jgi:hypothetical protein
MQPVIDNLSDKFSEFHECGDVLFSDVLFLYRFFNLDDNHNLKLYYRMIDNGFVPTKLEIRDIHEIMEQILEEENAPRKRRIFDWIPFMNKLK